VRTKLWICILVASGVVLGGALAWASIPGATSERVRANILHVCVDVEPGHRDYIVCDQQLGGEGTHYTGAECLAAGLPAVCVMDFVPHARVRPKMTLVMDEDMTSSLGNPETVGTAILLEFALGGQRHLLAELFEGDDLGAWNSIGSEFEVFGPIQFATGDGSFQFADGNLGPLAVELLAVADAHFQGVDLIGTVPVITDIGPSSNKLMSDHSGDELGSTSVRRVTIEFARLRP
jgi:hypothetical protein